MVIESKAGNKQEGAGKMQIKGCNHGNLLTGHLPLALNTLNSRWRISELIWTQGPP